MCPASLWRTTWSLDARCPRLELGVPALVPCRVSFGPLRATQGAAESFETARDALNKQAPSACAQPTRYGRWRYLPIKGLWDPEACFSQRQGRGSLWMVAGALDQMPSLVSTESFLSAGSQFRFCRE